MKLVLIIVLGLFLYLALNMPRESFTAEEANNLKASLAKDIKNFLTVNTTYEEYINFVNTKNNRFYDLIDPQNFMEMRTLLKLGQLNEEAIKAYMENYPN